MFHPDLARGEADAAARSRLFVRAREAFDAGDADALRALVERGVADAALEMPRAGDRAGWTRLDDRIVAVEARIAELRASRARLADDPMWELLARVRDGDAQGIDVLALLEASLVEQRDRLREELAALDALGRRWGRAEPRAPQGRGLGVPILG